MNLEYQQGHKHQPPPQLELVQCKHEHGIYPFLISIYIIPHEYGVVKPF